MKKNMIAVLLAMGLTQSILAEDRGFRFAEVNENSLGLWEGDKKVFVYNHGMLLKEGVPEDRARSTYVHPLYGLEGEVLTDDFPEDHYHHRGLFWAWPHVKVSGQDLSLWAIQGIHQRFVKWGEREATATRAVLDVENGWYIDRKKVVSETVKLTAHAGTDAGRAIDVELTWIPLDQPVTLQGAEGKSYGGLTLRFAPRENTVITTPRGNGKEDLSVTRLQWADLSSTVQGAAAPSGAAIFISPDHPDYPPTWLTRHYGVLCVGWPGVEEQTVPPGKPIHCRYRVWIHRGEATQEQLQAEYERYLSQVDES